MSTTIKLKKATPAPVVENPQVTAPVQAVAVPVKTQDQIEAEEYAAFKAARAAQTAVAPAPVAPAPVAPAPVVEVISTPEDAEEKAMTAPGHFRAVSGVEGGWNSTRHAIVPRLQIVQGNGELSKQYPQGTLLLQDDVFIPAANAMTAKVQVRFVPIQNRLQYRERLDAAASASGLKPRIAFSPEEVEAMGGTTAWINNVRPNWEETARVVLLAEQPQGIEHPAFDVIEGLPGKYTMCVYYAAGVAFPHFGKVLYTAQMSTLKIPGADGKYIPYTPKRWWKFTVATKPWGKYAPFCLVPNQLTEDTNAAVRTYIDQFLNATISDE